MKVAIVGSRDWPEPERVVAFVQKLAEKYPAAVIVSGGARGTDRLAEDAALEAGLSVISYRVLDRTIFRRERHPGRPDVAFGVASDQSFRRAEEALKYRNGLIVEEGDRVVAFDAATGGTKDAIEKTLAAGKPLARYFPGVQTPEIYDEAFFIAEMKRVFNATEVVDVDDIGGVRALTTPFDERRNTSRTFGVPPGALDEARRALADVPAPEKPEVEQTALFDIAPESKDDREYAGRSRGERERDEAMKRVEANADPEWRVEAARVVLAVARSKPTFTTDDVWNAGLAKPREPRALGPVVTELARAGFIEKTGTYVASDRRHASPLVEWRATAKAAA